MPVKAGVIRAAERTTRRGAAETFTGVVFQDPVITAHPPSRLGGSVVTFTPGARTAWHSHPVGQTLFCLSGVGRICFKGERPQVLNPGDTVNIPPDTPHWHGAGPNEPGNDHGLLVGIPHRRAWPAVNGIVKRFCTTPVPRTNVGTPRNQLLCNARLLCRCCYMKGSITLVNVVLDPVEKIFLRSLPNCATGSAFFCQV